MLDKNPGGHLLASELRRVFEELQPVLAQAGLLSSFTVTPAHLGDEFTEALTADLDRLLA